MRTQLRRSTVTFATLIVLLLSTAAWLFIPSCTAASVKSPTVCIAGSGTIELIWKSGKSVVYTSDVYVGLGGLESMILTPSRGWHIDALLVDGNPQVIVDEDGFSLTAFEVKRVISVAFLENGGVDDVDAGLGMGAYPDPDVGLLFSHVLTEGYAYAYVIGLQQPEQIGDSWDIQTTAAFDEGITVFLVCDRGDLPEGTDPYDLALWRTEIVLGDVNLDGRVDGTDVSIIANANPNDPNPDLDLNGDGVINDADVVLASHNVGLESIWEPLESWVYIEDSLVYVFGITEHLSVFGVTVKR